MLIITDPIALFSGNILENGNYNIEVRYHPNDTFLIPQCQRLLNTKCKLNFKESSNTESSFSVGMRLGSLLNGSETIFYVTDNEDLLKNPIYENGKASVHFVRSLVDVEKTLAKKSSTPPKPRKRRTKKEKTEVVPNIETAEPPIKVVEHHHKTENKNAVDVTDDEASVNGMNPPVKDEDTSDAVFSVYTAKPISQKSVDGTFSGDPDEVFAEKLKNISSGMEKAAVSIKDALYNSSKPEDLEYMLPMTMEKKYVDKWLPLLETYFDDLKKTMKAMKNYTPSDEIFRG